MDPLLLGVLIGFPLVWQLALTGFVYLDAEQYGMNRTHWAAATFFIPLFGFFGYLFSRDERIDEPEPDLYADGPYQIHHSRANEGPGVSEERDESDRPE